MELKELRSKIKNSRFTETLNELEVTVDLPHINESYRLVGLFNIYKFFTEQKDNWLVESLVLHENLFRDSINFFNTAVTQLDSFVTTYADNASYDANGVAGIFNSNFARYFRPGNTVFTAHSPAVEFLIDLHSKDADYFAPAFNYIVGNSLIVNTKKNITPLILAYEFENKDNSQIFHRRESEKRSFGKLRSSISTLANTYENEVIDFQKKSEEDYSNYRSTEDSRIEASRKTLAKWLYHNKTKYYGFLESTNANFQELFKNTNEEFTSLQNQYSELLSLQEPVAYWTKRAKELKKQGNWILGLTIGVAFVFATMVYLLLWHTPEGLLESLFGGDKAKALRWSFVFVIFVSVFFVIIRALLKYMFSNFHLARDAEEREKLTYLFISLRNREDVSDEERKIVFQALFSRSDTGLLKEDSSPTMPGISSVFEKIK